MLVGHSCKANLIKVYPQSQTGLTTFANVSHANPIFCVFGAFMIHSLLNHHYETRDLAFTGMFLCLYHVHFDTARLVEIIVQPSMALYFIFSCWFGLVVGPNIPRHR